MSQTTRFKGLTDAEVQASRREHGVNILTPPEKDPLWKRFLEKFSDPLIIILLIAGVLSIGISCYEFWGLGQGAGVFFEPIGIFIAILLATGLGFIFELKADKEFALLNQVNDDEPVQVIRNGNAIHAASSVNAARPVLEKLSARYPMVLVSNFYGNVEEVLRDFNIRQYFNGIIESAVVGVRKPDARIFMLGVVALGLEPEQVLVVGDSLRKDILPARSIGCQTAWIKGRGWTPEEDAAEDSALIPALASLPELLQA